MVRPRLCPSGSTIPRRPRSPTNRSPTPRRLRSPRNFSPTPRRPRSPTSRALAGPNTPFSALSSLTQGERIRQLRPAVRTHILALIDSSPTHVNWETLRAHYRSDPSSFAPLNRGEFYSEVLSRVFGDLVESGVLVRALTSNTTGVPFYSRPERKEAGPLCADRSVVCSNPATHYCTNGCGLLCAEHDRNHTEDDDRPLSHLVHERVTLEERIAEEDQIRRSRHLYEQLGCSPPPSSLKGPAILLPDGSFAPSHRHQPTEQLIL